MAITLNGNGTVTGLTALPKSAMASGSIIQTIQTIKKNTATGTSYASYTETGLSATITPTNANNKILITAHLYGSTTKSGWAGFRLYKAGSVLTDAISTSYTGSHYNVIDGHRQNNNWIVFGYNPNDTHEDIDLYEYTNTYLDTAGGTSAITYDLRGINRENGISWYINKGRSSDDADANAAPVSTLTLQEIVV
mgnify:CR=1 FL=1|tara:strand:- start:53 stop:634 length:582 start_codon:yes stop_codon:yes gene_type:complete